jgi:hypothetical protein
VPEKAPVEALIVNPVGSVGETLNTTFGVPPDEVTGVNGVATAEVVKVVEAAASVVVSAVETAKVNVLALVAPLASVAVTT